MSHTFLTQRITITALILISSTLWSQEGNKTNSDSFSFGLKAGVNISTIGGERTDNLSSVFDFHLGGLFNFQLSEGVSLQPEIVYSEQGFESVIEESFLLIEDNVNLNYLNIPLVLRFVVVDGFNLEAGPQMGFLISAKNKFRLVDNRGIVSVEETGTRDVIKQFSGFDVAAVGGATYIFPVGIFIAARANFGLTNINDDEFNDSTNRNFVLQFSTGFSF